MEAAPAQGALPWKRNLAVIWLILFTSVIGFSFVFPFLPLFVQKDLGIEDPGRAAFWSGMGGAAMGIAMFFSGPIWGVVGDRFGHKKNVLRAMVGSVVVMVLTGLSANVYQLVIFRFLSGLLSGNISPIMAIAASQAPRDRMRVSMGLIQMAQFSGFTVGPLLGGLLSDAVGFKNTFFAAGGLLALGAVVALLFLKESPREAGATTGVGIREYFRGFIQLLSTGAFPVMLLIMFMIFAAPAMTHPALPLLVEKIDPTVSASATTGLLFGLMALASAMAALGATRMSGTVRLRSILIAAAVAGGSIYGFMFVAQNLTQVFLIIGLVGLCSGALMATATAAIAMMVPRDQAGRGFGALQSVSSMSFGMGPLVGGGVAALLGLEEVFLFSAVLFLLIAVVVARSASIGETAPRAVEVGRPAD